MIYKYLSTFERLFSKLSRSEKEKSREALDRIIHFFETGVKPKGLGLKKLRKNYWEIRVDLSLRILFEYCHSEVSFVIIGNHNDIQRVLKNI